MRSGVLGLVLLVFLSTSTGTLQANAVLSTGSLNCSLAMPNPVSNTNCGPAGTNLASVAQLPGLSNGIAGVVYTMSGIITDTSIGTNSPYDTVLTVSTSGAPTGTGVIASVPIDMRWNFTLALGTIEGHTQINSWTLTYDLQDATAGNVSLFNTLPTITSGPLTISDLAPHTFTGDQAFNLTSPIDPSNGHILQQITVLKINWTNQNKNQDNLFIQFANNGLEFNEAPEPATLGLAGGALAFIVWFSRRKAKPLA